MKSFDSRFCHPSISLVATVSNWFSLALGMTVVLLVAGQAPDARALSVAQMAVNGRANPVGGCYEMQNGKLKKLGDF
jgi:hypothetical protein